LHSSQEGLRALGHFDRYAELLGAQALDQLKLYVGSEWIPVPSMELHYRACDQLALSTGELDVVGRWVMDRLQNRLLSTLGSAARGAGFEVWQAFAPMLRFTGRLFQGSHASVLKLGPKDLELTVHGNPLLEHGYFRCAFSGTIRGMLGLLGARSTFVRVRPTRAAAEHFALHIAWV
jgi:hypothetical protein